MKEGDVGETIGLIQSIIRETGLSSFLELTKALTSALGGRMLTLAEKLLITQVIRNNNMLSAECDRIQDNYYQSESSDYGPSAHFNQVLIVTAYSSDYTIGHVCSQINKDYAQAYGYEFINKVLTLETITTDIFPKKHCTWYKILILKQILQDREYLRSKQIRYLMWIDGDALVVNHAVSLQSIIARGENRDLIIAEDMNTGCLLNSGVFLLRVSNWSVAFLESVWNNDKYNAVTFYEQSTIVRFFKTINEGLDSVVPFHSYTKGSSVETQQAVKHFAHVAVLPCRELNTNRGVSAEEVLAYRASSPFADLLGPNERRSKGDTSSEVDSSLLDGSAQFIYHVAGMRDKLAYILTAIDKFGLRLDDQTSQELRPFLLYRGKNGQILPKELIASRKLELPV